MDNPAKAAKLKLNYFMKVFISYSHKDASMLERLHVHLAQLKRDRFIESWTDEEIPAGGRFEDHISNKLASAELFLALLSPDYIASNYCFEKEFKKAQELEQAGKLIIVPIILEPCEWRNTPFGAFKALPRDGKAVSDWSNANTAFLDIIQGLRALLQNDSRSADEFVSAGNSLQAPTPSRNYRVKKDFDSIQKIEFAEIAFNEMKDKMVAYLKEVIQVDENIKYRIISNDPRSFEAILVNRNKASAESTLKILNDSELHVRGQMNNYNTVLGKHDIAYTIGSERNNKAKGFEMSLDDFHLFWIQSRLFGGDREQKELSSKEMAESIWNDWLESVGII